MYIVIAIICEILFTLSVKGLCNHDDATVYPFHSRQMVEQESDLLRQVKDYEHEIEALR